MAGIALLLSPPPYFSERAHTGCISVPRKNQGLPLAWIDLIFLLLVVTVTVTGLKAVGNSHHRTTGYSSGYGA